MSALVPRERRDPATVGVELSNLQQPFVTEYTRTENGARVVTERPWQPGSRLLIRTVQGDIWARVRVVYCQTLPSNGFAIGISFLAWVGEWKVQS
jgi:hypothetical protein